MNNTVLNGLQLYTRKSAAGLAEEQRLTNLLLTKPFEVSTVLTQIFGGYPGEEVSILEYLTRGMGRIKVIEADNREYTWRVEVDTDEAIDIVKAEWNNSAVAATDTPGLNNSPIYLWLAKQWFGPGAVVSFDDRNYQVRLENEGRLDGDAYLYIAYMADGNPSSYVPPAQLAQGKKVSREGSAYEEGSEQADIVNYSAPFALKNHLTTMRLTYDITRSAATDVMIVQYKNPKSGKTSYMFSDMQEWRALRQWYKTVDEYHYYSKYNARPDGTVKVKGSTNRPVYIGAGVEEQISPSNRRNYTTMTTSLVQDFLGDLSFNKLGKGERKFLGLTGEKGMEAFSKMLENKASAFTTLDSKFITGSGQELTLGGQFVTWKMYNGVELTLRHFPFFDSIVKNRTLHPITGYPASSYDILFMDFGMRDGESNIKRIVKRGSENLMWHTAGSIAPGGNMAKSIGTLRSNKKDGYSVDFLTEGGFMITDPTTCGMLKLDVSH